MSNMTKAENVFANRILDMMEDNNCTMKEALEWDFEAFDFDIRGMDQDLLEDEFNFYLVKNGVTNQNIIKFYTEVISGQTQDFGLRKEKVK
jgi:hypothetical protein